MVYAGELEAIHMAITHAKDLTQTKSRIFSDSQPAMMSLAKPRRESGQAIIERILDDIDVIFLTTVYTVILHAIRMGARTCWDRGEREGGPGGEERGDREDKPDATTHYPQICPSESASSRNRTGKPAAMAQRKRHGGALTKYHKKKHDETKTEAKEAQLTNIRKPQQADAHRLDRTTEEGTQLAKRISRTIQHHR
jgi:hypothetical protein